ncbi:MAG: hypothetical protein R3C68_07225 [Myxococcota bacterium]
MKVKKTIKGTLVASAVAGLFACAGSGSSGAEATAAPAASTDTVVHCAGINACKGHAACAGAENACKAQNECKGKGWVEAPSAADCEAKGGTVVTM